MSCAVCGAGPPRAKLEKAGITILECPACGLAWWEPEAGFRPEGVYDDAYFAQPAVARGYDDYAGLEASLRLTFARRLDRLGRPAAGSRLLDVGAAYGYAVDEARRAGWNAAGVELSRAAARRGRDATGGRVAVASGLALPFGGGAFDAVTFWDVIEHLPEPHRAISEAARVLRPGGRLVLSTGDVGSLAARASGARWHLYTLPEHLFFFTRRSLRALLEAHALRVVAMRSEAAVYTLGYLVERLRKTLLGRGGGAPARWPGAGLRVPLNLFDIVTVEAERGTAGP